MFEPDLQRFEWGSDFALAARRGPEEARRFARRVRPSLDDETSDTLGLEFVELLSLPEPPDGQLGAWVAAAASFAGPETIARVGHILRSERAPAEWKVSTGLDILDRNRGTEAAIQLLLCSREGDDTSLLTRSRGLFHGYPDSTRNLLDVGEAQTPIDDLARYLAFQLERAMLEGARFEGPSLTRALTTPARDILARVIWARFERRRVADVFVVDPDGTGLVDADWNPVTLAADARIGVVHAAETTTEQRDVWGVMLADNEIVALFPQLDRELGLSYRVRLIDREVDHSELVKFLYARGWNHDRENRDYRLRIRGGKLVLYIHRRAGERRLLKEIGLWANRVSDIEDDDIVFSEAVAETIALLERFAPDLI